MKYKYEIKRTSGKTISVVVTNDNRIFVRCPWSLSDEKIQKFYESREKWVEKVVERNAVRLAANDDIIEYRKIYLYGEKLPLVIGQPNAITSEGVFVKRLEDVVKLYKEYCSHEFLMQVDGLAKLTNFEPKSVSIKDYKGRWGCCDAKNNLIFNYKLFMLPPDIQRYVIIHELCHILCHNHSPAFWKLVADFEPKYKELKKRLKDYDFLTTLY